MKDLILFKKNPKLESQVVITVDGSQEYRRNCKFVKEKYYRMYEHIHFIESEQKWYRVESNKIRYINGKWELKSK